MNKIVKIIAPILVLGGSVMIVNTLAASKPEPEKTETKARPVSLYVDEVMARDIQLNVTSQGEVKSTNHIELVAEVSGRIMSVSNKFSSGAEFQAGETLVKIDDSEYQLAVTRAESKVAEAKVGVARELANAKIKKDQWKYKNPGVEPSDFALNIPQVADAKSKLKAAQAELVEAKRDVQRTNITVPFRGRVMDENIGVGQFISTGKVLGNVFAVDQVEIQMALTDSQLAELNLPMGYMAKNNQGPVVSLKARVGQNQHQWKGQIVRTQASVDKDTRLIYATAVVNDPYGSGADNGTPLAVGMFVAAEIESVNSQHALVLPRDALRNKDKVFVINDESRLEIRTVSVLSTNQDHVMLLDGVKAGEWAVTSSAPGVADGVEVQAIKRQLVSQL